MADEAPRPRSPLFTPYRVVVSMLLAAAAAGIITAVTMSVDEETVGIPDTRVVLVRPEPNSNALRQERIFARVADTYTGVLEVDGVEIPEDQLDRREGLSAIGFTPGPGTETGALDPGRRCARVIFWPIASTRAESASHQWCWEVN
ncbi:MAG TPA: hypothetical protein VNB24_00210 [Acidimicrobiales bacterium]|nr:hypothetical protein [Acidimicrobiales bacterium]